MAPERDDDLSRREIERQLSDLRRDRLHVQESIKKLSATQARIFRDAEDRKRDRSRSGKRSRSRSRSRSGKKEEKKDGDSKDDKEEKEDKDNKEEKDKEEKDKEEKGDKEDKDDKQKEDGDKDEKKENEDKGERKRERDGRPKKLDPRSRNIFGKMLGHLHSAKSRLDTEKASRGRELRDTAMARTEEKISVSKMNIKEFRKEKFDQMMKEEEEKCTAIEKAIEEKEGLLLQRRLESHYGSMLNFIRTKTEPTIFFLPAKHVKETEKALEETRVAIKHKLASLKAQCKPEDSEEAAARAKAAEAAEAGEKASDKGSDDEGAGKEKTDKDDEKDKEDDAGSKKEASDDDAEDGNAKKKAKTDGDDKDDKSGADSE